MNFSHIWGHDRPLSILKRVIANKTLAHAYLFSGDAGIGKRMTAFALAAAMNCREPGPDGGCGVCPSCRKVAALSHPDVHVMAADGEEIKIDQIRQIQASLSLKAFEGIKKVLIMDGAEAMNVPAANAFLKTLEEPPGDTLIILVCSMPQSLLPTIRSRCQEIRFLPLPRHTLAQALITKRGLGESDALFLAALAQGSLGRGLEMDVETERAKREDIMSLWTGLGQKSPGEVLAQAEALSKDRDRLDHLLAIGVEWLRDVMVFQKADDEELLVNPESRELLRQWSDRVPLQRMLLDMDLFIRSRELLDSRVSAQLVAENLLMKLGKG